jgi:serine protease Do
VGLIRQSYHPEVVNYMNKLKDLAKKQNQDEAVKNIEAFLKGGFGSGFVYLDAAGNNYIITNYHVITKAYSISVEFAGVDGAKKTFSGLTILAADEDMDLALLAFPPGEKPFTSALPLSQGGVEDGLDVYSAGYPGLGGSPLWQFGRGIISNSSVIIPPSDNDGRERGPWIQHTAQIDAGNSGGPLLILPPGGGTGYEIAGVNTASGVNRQAANYAVPVDRVREFLRGALEGANVSSRERLDKRLAEFVEALGSPRAVYARIAHFLSNECIASNAELAITEVSDKAGYTVQRDIFNQYIFDAIDSAVGWLMEAEFRTVTKEVIMHPVLGPVTGNVDGTWTAILVFPDNKEVATIWVNEFGMWRLKSAGTVTGTRSAIDDRMRQRQVDKNLRTEFSVAFDAGFSYLGLGSGDPQGGLLDVSVISGSGFFSGGHLMIRGQEFIALELLAGYTGAIKLHKIALFPYGALGGGILISRFAFGFSAQGGLMVTGAAAPGLFLKAAYHYSHFGGGFESTSGFGEKPKPMKTFTHGVSLSVGFMAQ